MLSHLEFEQFRRSLAMLRPATDPQGYGPKNAVLPADVLEILTPYVEGFTPPNPHQPMTIVVPPPTP